jgi:hypothetical protein
MATPLPPTRVNIQNELDRMAPAAKKARLGTALYEITQRHNALLDLLAGAGITGINAGTLAPLRVKLPEQR